MLTATVRVAPHSGVQLAEPAAVALHAGRVEELEAGRLRRRRLHHHLPRQVRRECLVFFLVFCFFAVLSAVILLH